MLQKPAAFMKGGGRIEVGEVTVLTTPKLSEEDNEIYRNLLGGRRKRKKANREVARNHGNWLPGGWLDDENINETLRLLVDERSRVLEGAEKCYSFDSHFYTSFSKSPEGLDEVFGIFRVFTPKLSPKDLVGYGYWFFPINVNQNHWVMVVVYLKTRRIEYYDSLSKKALEKGNAEAREERLKEGRAVVTNVEKIVAWIFAKANEKFEPFFKVDEGSNTPQQRGACDCGIYVICVAYFASIGVKIRRKSPFQQTSMPYYRRKFYADGITRKIVTLEKDGKEVEVYKEE